MRRLLYIALILTGCGHEPRLTELKGYAYQFEADAKRFGVNIDTRDVTFEFADIKADGQIIWGQCYGGESPRIVINRRHWNSYNDAWREMLVYHELGHCVLNLPHSNGGIMASGLMDRTDYEARRDELVEEMFKSLQ